MPERLECEVLQKARCINTLTEPAARFNSNISYLTQLHYATAEIVSFRDNLCSNILIHKR